MDALARALRDSATGAVVLTGAGISIASGVPAFRSDGGLWERYDPAEYATIDALRRDPEKVWGFLRELHTVVGAARPNPAHLAIADLERSGHVQLVVTQNVDALHQAAGSERVIELHGSADTLSCLDCGAQEDRAHVERRTHTPVPRCRDCGGVLKPDVILFGEDLPVGAYRRAQHAARNTDLMLVVGTSAEVEPAASLPAAARRHGATVWEINPEPCLDVASRTIAATAEQVLPLLVDDLLGRGRLRRAWRQRGRTQGG